MRKAREIPLLIRLADAGVAALEALWPRSAAAREVERLTRDGFEPGALYEVDFSVSFDEESAEEAMSAVRDAGFAIVGRVGSPRVFLIVRASMPLRAFHLSRAVALLDRLVTPFFGYATLLAPGARLPAAPDGKTASARFV